MRSVERLVSMACWRTICSSITCRVSVFPGASSTAKRSWSRVFSSMVVGSTRVHAASYGRAIHRVRAFWALFFAT